MHKRGIITICTVILLLAIFFQLNRMDIFPKFFNRPNIYQEITVADQLDEELLAKKENFLLLFDPTSVYSTYGKSQAEKYLIKIKRNIHSFQGLLKNRLPHVNLYKLFPFSNNCMKGISLTEPYAAYSVFN